MKVNHDAFKPIPKNEKPKRVRKVKPKISWAAFKNAPDTSRKKRKK